VSGHERRTYGALAAFVVLLWFATLSIRPLFNTDEGRYAEIPREMLAGGDWVIPHLNGLAYIEKPPLQYWATALSLRWFGLNEFAARAYTGLCAILTVLVVWFTARHLKDQAAAWRAAAMLASMVLFLVMGQMLTLDMGLTLYTTLSLAAFLRAQSAQGPQQTRWMLLAWAAAALGVLSKGLVAALIPAAVLTLYSLYARDAAPWRRLHAGKGLVLFLAITVPWHWLAARRLADFLEFFFVHEHLARYLTPSADREESWWFFAMIFVLGSAPWTQPALRALGGGWRRPAVRGQFSPTLFLWIWVVFVGVFFSLSDSKLIPYILPAMPALALLMALAPAESLPNDVLHTALLTVFAGIVLALVCLYGPKHVAPSERSAYFLSLVKPLSEIAALLAASGLYVLAQRHRDATRGAVFLGVGWCLAGLLLMRAAAAVAPVYSGVELARALPGIAPDAALYSVGTYDQTLPFYWRRTVELVAYRGELDYGLKRDPGAELTGVDEFLTRWDAQSTAYAVMERSMFNQLKSRDVPMRELARDANRVLVARP
jgi:4-amino-4-deoxy-L-arabinose transferase-like glycosyltransferase